jgi:nucleoside-triphosphatase THEP1
MGEKDIRKTPETKSISFVHDLSEKWIKASITGTIWAASEIVLGSFLHNLRIPFSGNILTAIGLIILISISYTWTEKGLFWRAGLICAVMKAMSPSAIIFGPMIAIFSEAILLELFVRLLGRTFAGYAIGAMSAMSWNLFQKIMNYIIFYGANIIEVYSDLLKLAQKQLNIQTDIVWLPIIILLVIYALFGLLAAVIGIKVGRKMLNQPVSDFTGIRNEPIKKIQDNTEHIFNYSITWLIADIALIICSFILLNYTSWIIWSLAITMIILIWSVRYKRAMRQLSKPKFWILFVFITLITAFIFTKVQTGENVLQQGLLTGFQMNFRAAVMIVGFSVLGTELYNPVIRNFFYNTSFKNLPLALELSVESLPSFISNIPDFKSLLRNPVSIFYRVISQADNRLFEIKNKSRPTQKIFIISGAVGEGKTTYTKKLTDYFKKNNIKTGGILSERIMTDSVTTGYDVVNIETGEKEIFLRQNEDCGYEKIGKFTISPKGLAMGKAILSSLVMTEDMIVIIDEVGLLELRNNGWSECINKLLDKARNHILITVRTSFIDEVIKKWNLNEAIVFKIAETDYLKAGMTISKYINLKTEN